MKINNECEQCGKEFKAERKNKMFCSKCVLVRNRKSVSKFRQKRRSKKPTEDEVNAYVDHTIKQIEFIEEYRGSKLKEPWE